MNARRRPRIRWEYLAMLVLFQPIVPEAGAQSIPAGPAPAPATARPVCTRRGRIHRMLHHTAHTLQDDFIGYPETFVEPPLGAYINRQFAVQVSKADPHRFTLYQSDFLPGSDRFSPTGASRLNLMYGRLPQWSGPILVEWSPDEPELAESRRRAVLATLASTGMVLPADRVLIGPSPYPGLMGVEAANNHVNTIGRTQAAAQTFQLPPTESASMGVR